MLEGIKWIIEEEGATMRLTGTMGEEGAKKHTIN